MKWIALGGFIIAFIATVALFVRDLKRKKKNRK